MMNKLLYFDYMATTPVDPRVADVMQQCLMMDGVFGNPASNTHRYGWAALTYVNEAREHVASLIGANPKEIIFTSGATEAINLALKGAAKFYARQGRHVITMRSEHKAVLDTCGYLETQGFDITYLNPNADGLLDLSELAGAVRPETILASVMHVNNETGVIQDIEAIGNLLRKKGVLFHVDAAQSLGKLPIDLQVLPVDLMSLTSHKLYGPKGVGALYVRRRPRVQLTPILHGGGHEMGYRAGTLPTHQIAGMGAACAIAKQEMYAEMQRIQRLKDRLWGQIVGLGGLHRHGAVSETIAGCLNFSVDDVDAESLVHALYDVALSTGSACNSANPEPSHVLTSMGISRDEAGRALRMSLGRFTTEQDVDHAAKRINEQVTRLRALSPFRFTLSE